MDADRGTRIEMRSCELLVDNKIRYNYHLEIIISKSTMLEKKVQSCLKKIYHITWEIYCAANYRVFKIQNLHVSYFVIIILYAILFYKSR